MISVASEALNIMVFELVNTPSSNRFCLLPRRPSYNAGGNFHWQQACFLSSHKHDNTVNCFLTDNSLKPIPGVV